MLGPRTQIVRPPSGNTGPMTHSLPEWQIPSDLASLIEDDEDLTWESDHWLPIQLSVIGGTSYQARDIEQSWQIEYEPEDCDGYDLLDRIRSAVAVGDPEIQSQLRCDDTEDAAVVIWVECEELCRRLMAIVWPLVEES